MGFAPIFKANSLRAASIFWHGQIWADLLIKIKTICHCGRKATMNLRIDDEGNPVCEERVKGLFIMARKYGKSTQKRR